jgi:hypothetical protein
MADYRERTAPLNGHEPLGQGRHEFVLCDCDWLAVLVAEDGVGGRRPGAITREEERDHAVQVRVGLDALVRERVSRPGGRPSPWPLLADEGALI